MFPILLIVPSVCLSLKRHREVAHSTERPFACDDVAWLLGDLLKDEDPEAAVTYLTSTIEMLDSASATPPLKPIANSR